MVTPKHLIIWASGMLMAFDGSGKQIASLQGPITEELRKALAASGEDTVYSIGSWMHGTMSATRMELDTLADFLGSR